VGKATVVHIITKLELGGAQQNTLFTIAHLNRNDYKPVLISGTEGMLVEDAKKINDLEVYLIPELVREIRPVKDMIAFFKIKQILHQLQGNTAEGEKLASSSAIIVHTHSSKAGIIGRWAAKIAGVRLVIHTIHGFSFNDYQPSLLRAFYIFLERVTSLITTKYIAVSRSNIETGVKKNIFNREKAVFIRSGIDIDSFQKTRFNRIRMREALKIEPAIPLVAMIACFKPQKAPLDFIRMAKAVSDEICEVRFLLVGDGVLRPRIEKMIRELAIEDKVILLGWRRDIPDIMSCIDILVLTSLWEGLPRVVPQAMAAGIPVVATQVDGSPETVRNGVNGYLLLPGDIRGMAEQIAYLIKNPEKARAMGEKGKQLVGEFDVWSMVSQQANLYKSLLEQTETKNLNESV